MRPKSITASIVAMLIAIISVIAIALVLPVLRNLEIKTPNLSSRFFIINHIIPGIAAAVDVVFLFIRKRWVYYFNLILVGFYIALFIPITLFAIFFVRADNDSQIVQIIQTMFVIAPILLLVWLFLDLLIRKEAKNYLFRTDKSSADR